MTTFNLDYEKITHIPSYPVDIFSADDGTEQSQIRFSKMFGGFRLRSPSLPPADMEDYLDFFKAREGASESFTFVSPYDSNSYTVRFVPDSLSIEYEGAMMVAEFDFKIVDVLESA